MACDYHWDKSEQYPGEFSRGLDIVKEFVGKHGFVLKVGATRNNNVAGTIDFKKRIIILREETACAGCWLVTALHEAGHMIHFLHYGRVVKRSKDVLEHVAEDFAKKLAISLKIDIIDTKEWAEHTETSLYLNKPIRQHKLQKEYVKMNRSKKHEIS